jgi:hypothetical protein
MEIDYRVRAISLLEFVNSLRHGNLVPDAFFQRNLVWREVHKKDFIKTILLGYPFPQIFISKGKVDIDNMSTVSCIVDGQQRANAIMGYIDNEFDVEGKFYKDLKDKENFLKYEIATIELDLENNDPIVQEIFQRINRTSNSLTAIEKTASEYATSYYMLTAKLLSDQINLTRNDVEDFREDPNIPDEFYEWAKTQKVKDFNSLITKKEIFTVRDIARKVHLSHVLNIMSTMVGGNFNRNVDSLEYLNSYQEKFDGRDKIVELLNISAGIILKIKLSSKSYWYNKSNIFTLITCVAALVESEENLDLEKCKQKLIDFAENIPDEYKLAATEAVNNKKERQIRYNHVMKLLKECIN